MGSQSAISLDPALFSPSSISPETHAFNQKLQDIMSGAPRWYEVGAPKYRQMRANGETPLPAAVHLPNAEDFSIPSRDSERAIPARILKPTNSTPIKGVFLHIHGGGWVLQDEKSQDPYLQSIANSTGLLCLSIGYRLAPEHPFPAGPEDCYDAAEWLIEHSSQTFGVPLSFIGGESAGGHLSMLTAIHLLSTTNFSLKGLLLHFGAYDLSFTPSVYTFNPSPTLVLDRDIMTHFIQASLPNHTADQLKTPLRLTPLRRSHPILF